MRTYVFFLLAPRAGFSTFFSQNREESTTGGSAKRVFHKLSSILAHTFMVFLYDAQFNSPFVTTTKYV